MKGDLRPGPSSTAAGGEGKCVDLVWSCGSEGKICLPSAEAGALEGGSFCLRFHAPPAALSPGRIGSVPPIAASVGNKMQSPPSRFLTVHDCSSVDECKSVAPPPVICANGCKGEQPRSLLARDRITVFTGLLTVLPLCVDRVPLGDSVASPDAAIGWPTTSTHDTGTLSFRGTHSSR